MLVFFFFSVGLRYIGMGVAFLLNIAGGTVLGSLIPLLISHVDYIFEPFGLVDILGLIVFILGTILSSKAAQKREKEKNLQKEIVNKGQVAKGIFFGILSGAVASLENISYTYSLPYFQHIEGSSCLPIFETKLPLGCFVFWRYFFYNHFVFWYVFVERNLGIHLEPLALLLI